MARKNEKEDLLAEIETLKSVIETLEGPVVPRHFAFFRKINKMADLEDETTKCRTDSVKNVDMEVENNFYEFSGMHCTKFEESYVFEFSAGRRIHRGNIYGVQILNKGERGQLGNWILPVSVNVDEILQEAPIDDFVNLRRFLRRIKHLVECHVAREEQYGELKSLVDDLANCETDTNPGYTRITIKMAGLKDPKDPESCHNIACYLFYKPNEARPRRFVCEPTDELCEFTDSLGKKLQKHFKPFGKFALAEAFRRVSGSGGIFVWEPIEREQDVGLAQVNSHENEEFNRDENFEGNDDLLEEKEKSIDEAHENSQDVTKMEEENSQDVTKMEGENLNTRKRKGRKRKTSGLENPVGSKKKRGRPKK